MAQFSDHMVYFEAQESEMVSEPDTRLYCEMSGSERFPTFTVHMVIDDKHVSKRNFQTEGNAQLCMDALYPALTKDPTIAIQEFQAWSA